MEPSPSPANSAEFDAYQTSLCYDSQRSVSVVCQQEGYLLSLRFTNYEYSGGAHGNFGRAVHSFNLRTGR